MLAEYKDETQTLNCSLLLQAIDFFTQSLHLEQLSYYGYEMVHEMLDLKASCLFIKEGDAYHLKHQKEYGVQSYTIPDTDPLRKVATLFGRVMTTEQTEYFEPEHLEAFSVKIVIPLIVKDQLVGFIFSNGLKRGAISPDQLTFAFAIMQLMNRSYENAKNFLELEQKNFELDKKIFNLFFINHCSRTLLAELNLDKIYMICIDIIRELTASSVTSFGLYDETRKKVVLKGYQDILTFRSHYAELELKPVTQVPTRVVYHIHEDRAALAEIFADLEEFEALQAEYVVLLVKDHILGFVTIGKPVSERVYDQTLFELIETIATSIYISVVNAQLFERINQQNEVIGKKYETLQKMNRITRNINSCESLEELCTIAMQSLSIAYGVRKGFISIVGEEGIRVMGDINIPHLNGSLIHGGAALRTLDEKGCFYDFTTEPIRQFFPEFEPARHGEANCLVIAPIRIDRMALGDEGTLGYLVVFETESALKEEEILLIDTLANSIAPIVYQMNETQRIQTRYVLDQGQLLLEALKEMLKNRQEYFIDFKVWYKRIRRHPFEALNLTPYEAYKTYYVDQVLFCPLEDESASGQEEGLFDEALVIEDLEDFLEQTKLI